MPSDSRIKATLHVDFVAMSAVPRGSSLVSMRALAYLLFDRIAIRVRRACKIRLGQQRSNASFIPRKYVPWATLIFMAVALAPAALIMLRRIWCLVGTRPLVRSILR